MNTAIKKKNLLAYAAAAMAVFILLTVIFFKQKNTGSVTYSRALMGTVVEITLMDGDRTSFERAANAAFIEIERLENILSSYKTDSNVSEISRRAGGPLVKAAPELMEVLSKAVMVARLSGGAFDPTVGALAKVWGYSGEKGYLPDEKEIKSLLPLVDWQGIISNKEASLAGLKKKGVVLNLGGIAKGYIADKAAEALKANGVTRAIVKAGGDMIVFQKEDAGKRFTIGIQHPRKSGRLLGECYPANGAVSTSGDYERYFEKNNIRYHHILDPKTGWPANLARSATIITPDATLADALSTAVFVMGPEKGMALIESLPDVQAVIVNADGMVFTSKNFRGRIY